MKFLLAIMIGLIISGCAVLNPENDKDRSVSQGGQDNGGVTAKDWAPSITNAADATLIYHVMNGRDPLNPNATAVYESAILTNASSEFDFRNIDAYSAEVSIIEDDADLKRFKDMTLDGSVSAGCVGSFDISGGLSYTSVKDITQNSKSVIIVVRMKYIYGQLTFKNPTMSAQKCPYDTSMSIAQYYQSNPADFRLRYGSAMVKSCKLGSEFYYIYTYTFDDQSSISKDDFLAWAKASIDIAPGISVGVSASFNIKDDTYWSTKHIQRTVSIQGNGYTPKESVPTDYEGICRVLEDFKRTAVEPYTNMYASHDWKQAHVLSEELVGYDYILNGDKTLIYIFQKIGQWEKLNTQLVNLRDMIISGAIRIVDYSNPNAKQEKINAINDLIKTCTGNITKLQNRDASVPAPDYNDPLIANVLYFSKPQLATPSDGTFIDGSSSIIFRWSTKSFYDYNNFYLEDAKGNVFTTNMGKNSSLAFKPANPGIYYWYDAAYGSGVLYESGHNFFFIPGFDLNSSYTLEQTPRKITNGMVLDLGDLNSIDLYFANTEYSTYKNTLYLNNNLVSTTGNEAIIDIRPLTGTNTFKLRTEFATNLAWSEPLTIIVAPKLNGICVSTNGNDGNPGTRKSPVLTITKGIALAKANNLNTIYVASGTYYENITILDQNLKLYGGYDESFIRQSGYTALDGSMNGALAGPLLRIKNVSGIQVTGFVLRNNKSVTSGCGLRLENVSSSLISNCIISNNTYGNYSCAVAGAYMTNASGVVFDGLVTNNTAFCTGGMFLDGCYNTTINGSIAGNTGYGCAGLTINGSGYMTVNSLIAGNSGTSIGGIDIRRTCAYISVRGPVINNKASNSASAGGVGGIIYLASSYAISIDSSKVYNNTPNNIVKK